MSIRELHDTLIQLNEEQIIRLVQGNRKGLKLLFINLEPQPDTASLLGKILVYLGQLDLKDEIKNQIEVQFLYTEIAFYFKKGNKIGFVSNCINYINESVLKFRLLAWIHSKQYTRIENHIDHFSKYLNKLSSAITDGDESYENDVYRDLNEYFENTISLMTIRSREDLIPIFAELFQNEDLISEFPILNLFSQNRYQFSAELNIKEDLQQIFEPSDFTEKLFDDKFLTYIKEHPKTQWPAKLMGYSGDEVRLKIINFGQADFDRGYGDLKTHEIVKLYSYFNMRKHYYSSLYLFQRFEIIQTYFESAGRIKFVDIGCGPATCGIALVDHLNSLYNSKISFDYFGVDYYQSMREAAEDYMLNDIYENNGISTYVKDLADLDFDVLSNANSIFINTCYLFASDTLNEVDLARNVTNIRKSKSDIPCFILFQNTTNLIKSTKYFNFKNLLPESKTIFSDRVTIRYNNNSRNYFPTMESVFFEIIQLN